MLLFLYWKKYKHLVPIYVLFNILNNIYFPKHTNMFLYRKRLYLLWWHGWVMYRLGVVQHLTSCRHIDMLWLLCFGMLSACCYMVIMYIAHHIDHKDLSVQHYFWKEHYLLRFLFKYIKLLLNAKWTTTNSYIKLFVYIFCVSVSI